MTNFLSKWWHSMDVDYSPLTELFENQLKVNRIIAIAVDKNTAKIKELQGTINVIRQHIYKPTKEKK